MEVHQSGELLLRSLLMLISVIEAHDAYTGGHCWRVAQYAKLLGRQLGLAEKQIQLLGIGGFVHDLGKVGIPDAILNKKGPLTEVEYALMQKHPRIGHTILQFHPLAHLCQDAVLFHHERYDGMGYPDQRQGKEISLVARVISLADTFDALTSHRPYRTALPIDEAITILEAQKHKQFDGEFVDAFLDPSIRDHLFQVIGHSNFGIPMVDCPNCGPTIAISRQSIDGDSVVCHACKRCFRLREKHKIYTVDATEDNIEVSLIDPDIDSFAIAELIDEFTRYAPEILQSSNGSCF